PLSAATLATNADPADLAAWLSDRLQPPDVYKWPLNVLVVRSGGRTVLIDSGAGSEFPHFPPVVQLASRLAAPGIQPASVTAVVLTHLHVDHVGGLLADGLRGRLRPDVPIHLAAAEQRLGLRLLTRTLAVSRRPKPASACEAHRIRVEDCYPARYPARP